jgi:hypothetical protein
MHPSDDDDITQEELTTSNLPRLVPITSNDTDCLVAVSRSESILTRSSSVISRESTSSSSNNSSSILSTDMLQDEFSGVFERKMEDAPIIAVELKNKTNDETNNDKEVCIDDTIKQEQQQQQQSQPQLQSKEEEQNETDDIIEKETTNEENNQKQELVAEEMKVKVDIETMEKVNELLSPAEGGNNGEKKEKEIEWISRLKENKNEGEKEEGEKGDDTETVEDAPGCGVGCGVGESVGVGSGVSSMQPLKMLRKGATAVVGGTMVGVGLVMIPLPTPFGAVVASGGLAVLGTEFTEAKELNDRLIVGAKGHFNTARNALVKGIESMDQKGFNADSSTSASASASGDIPSTNNTISKSSSEKDEIEKNNTVIKLSASASSSFGWDDANENGNGNGNDDNNEDSTDDSPLWLHMNPIEQERQEKLAKEKYRRENQTYYEQTKENLTKRTGKFLSRNILPLIKKKEVEEETEENLSTGGTNDDGNDNSDDPVVVAAKEEEEEEEEEEKEKDISQINETSGTVTKTEKEVGEENDEGYVVISPKDDII